MPVDFMGLFVALAVWVGGTGCAYRRIRAAMLARHDAARDGPLPVVRPIFWTVPVFLALAAVGILVLWLYDRVTGRA